MTNGERAREFAARLIFGDAEVGPLANGHDVYEVGWVVLVRATEALLDTVAAEAAEREREACAVMGEVAVAACWANDIIADTFYEEGAVLRYVQAIRARGRKP